MTNYDPNSIEVIVVSLTFIESILIILCDVTNYDPNSIEVIVVSLTFITILCMWPYRNVLKLLKSIHSDHPVRCDQLRPKLYWSYCGKSNIHYNLPYLLKVVSLTFTDHPVRCDQLRPKLYWSYCGKSNIHYNLPSCAMWPNYDPNSIEVIVVSLTFITILPCDLTETYWSYCGKSNIHWSSCAMWPITTQTLLKLLW